MDIRNYIESRLQTSSGTRDGDWKQMLQKYHHVSMNRILGPNSLGIRPSLPFPAPLASAVDLEVLSGIKGMSPMEIDTLTSLFAFQVL